MYSVKHSPEVIYTYSIYTCRLPIYTTVYNIHVHIYKQTSDTHINVMKKKLHAWF